MIEDADLFDDDIYGAALQSVGNVIAHDLYPELASDSARGRAADALATVARIVAQLAGRRRIESSDVPLWTELAMTAPVSHPRAGGRSLEASASVVGSGLRSIISSPPTDNRSEILNWLDSVGADLAAFRELSATELPHFALRTSSEPAASGIELPGKLSEYLARRFPDLGADPVTSICPIIGGRTKFTGRFELGPNDLFPRRLVLRMDHQAHTGTRCSDELPLLRAVRDAGVPVPEAFFAEDDPSILGGAFVVTEEVVDAEPGGAAFPEDNDGKCYTERMGRDVARALARLHELRAIPGATASPTSGEAALDEYLRRWRASSRTANPLIAETGFAWLRANVLPPGRPITVVHGDIGAHNVMVRDGGLAAILDWELAHLGDPAEDLGYAKLTFIDQLMPWDEFVAEYIRAGGDPAACDPDAVAYFSVSAWVRNLVMVATIREQVRTALDPDIEVVRVAIDLGARVQDYVTRALRRGGASVPSSTPRHRIT